MKIAVIDIETNGFHTNFSSIVEIGISLVDTEKGTIKLIYDEVVNDKFTPHSKWNQTAWIFENTDLTREDVASAVKLKDQKADIQKIFDQYPVTAFNSSFDFRFLTARGFVLNPIKCLMKSTAPYIGKKAKVSVIEAYKHLFPEEKNWTEKHRGGSDSMDEAKILLKLCELKKKQAVIL